MRGHFGHKLAEVVRDDSSVFLLAGDVGFGVLDSAFKAAPTRCFNMGASEQAMIGAAVGLSYEGKTPICYSITPFLLYRPFEWIRNYLNEEKANVKLVGCGRNDDYGKLGYTHWCMEQEAVLDCLPNVRTFFPENLEELDKMWPEFLSPGPSYLSLER